MGQPASSLLLAKLIFFLIYIYDCVCFDDISTIKNSFTLFHAYSITEFRDIAFCVAELNTPLL